MNDHISKLLLKKWEENSLHHFYILKAKSSKQLSSWIDNLLIDIVKRDPSTKNKDSSFILKKGHPDLIIIDNGEDSYYSIEKNQLRPLIEISKYSSFELKKRFVIVKNCHLIKNNYANKLLKILEEPPLDTSIFFLNPHHRPLLKTLQSRGITLQIPPNYKHLPNAVSQPPLEYFQNLFAEQKLLNKATSEGFIEYLKDYNNKGQLIEALKRYPKISNEWLKLVLHYESQISHKYQKKQELIDHLKWFETSKVFNNSALERIHGILGIIFEKHY